MAEKIWCKNLLCKGAPYAAEINRNMPLDLQLKNEKCPHCGQIGAMPEKSVLGTREIINQIASWSNILLYKKAFKVINYKKLPKTMEQQRTAIRKQNRIKITKPIVRK